MKSFEFVRLVQREKLPVFTVAYAASAMGKGKKYASLFLSRLCDKGEIAFLERGKYYVTGTGAYAVASNVIYPAYVSMLSALKYHGLTTQNIAMIDVVSVKRHAAIKDVAGYSVNFINFESGHFYGFYRDKENGAFVAYVEKAIVDSLYMNNVPLPYIEEALETAKSDGKLDIQRLDAFARMMKSAELMKRLGKLYAATGIVGTSGNALVISNESA